MIGFTISIPKGASNTPDLSHLRNYFLPEGNQDFIQHQEGFYSYFITSNKLHIKRNIAEAEGVKLALIGKLIPYDILEKIEQQQDNYAEKLLKIYLSKGISGIYDKIDGAGTVVIFDSKKKVFYLITDKLGFAPVYYYEAKDFYYFSSNPDAISYVVKPQNLVLDKISIAMYLAYGRLEYPYTYYENIQQLPPASATNINKSIINIQNYWTPEFNPIHDLSKSTSILKDAIIKSVQKTTHPYWGSHGIFLSGGADSRAILFSALGRSKLQAATFYDVKNEEFNTAHELAQRAKVPHHGLAREFDHYILSLEKYAKTCQGVGALNDNHYLSFYPQIIALGAENWHTGCFADWLFKGLAYNTGYKKLLGKVLPTWKTLAPFKLSFYKSPAKINSSYSILVEDRIQQRYSHIKPDSYDEINVWEIEKSRLWPMNREADFGGRSTLYADFNWTPLFATNELIDAWSRIPYYHKLNGLAWKKAVAQICKDASDIKDNNWGGKLDASLFMNTINFIKEVIRRKYFRNNKDKTSNQLHTTGSWPNFNVYLTHSKALSQKWLSLKSDNNQMLSDIMGFDVFSLSPQEWSKLNADLFFRLLIIAQWNQIQNNDFKLPILE